MWVHSLTKQIRVRAERYHLKGIPISFDLPAGTPLVLLRNTFTLSVSYLATPMFYKATTRTKGDDEPEPQDQDLEMSHTDPTVNSENSPGRDSNRTQQVWADQQQTVANNAPMLVPPSAAYFHPGPLQHVQPPQQQHHPMMAPMNIQNATGPYAYGVDNAAAAAAAAANGGGGISWGADVRQIDRTGHTLECIDSETVVSGLTMPTWSAQRPWEAPFYDTPYPDDLDKAASPASASYGSRRSENEDDGTVKTHWTFWDKKRNRRLCVPFVVLLLAAIGVIVGVMVAGKGGGGGGNENGPPNSSSNPVLSNPGNENSGSEGPTLAPTLPPRGVGGVIVTTITESPAAVSLMPSRAPTSTPTMFPTVEPGNPTKRPSTNAPSPQPSPSPTKRPTTSEPTRYPSPLPTFDPTEEPTSKPTPAPSPAPTLEPSPEPTPVPSPVPTLEPSPEPSRKPTPKPSPVPTDDVPCTICTDERSWWMENIGGMDCDEWEFAYTARCKHDADWRAAKWCRHSCFVNGAGYAGDNCCVQTMRAGDDCSGDDCDESSGGNVETVQPTSGPTVAPTEAATEPVTGAATKNTDPSP